MFLHYADIVIFVLGHFIVTHPVQCSRPGKPAERRL